MKNSFVRNTVFSILIILVPVALAIATGKYAILGGLGVFFITSWICSIMANMPVKKNPKKDHTDILIRVIGIFGNLVYAAFVIYGFVGVIMLLNK